ncbi:MAG: hypothetical protein IPL61_38960 [Myxococcales bacterium]|nr:hypothetical protein [Myxococcales bacterium]
MPRPRLALALVVTSLGGGACGEPVPTTPTWFADVQPIVLANCGRCHGPMPSDPRLIGIRLDRYVALDDATLDAWDYRDAIVTQAAIREAPVMPPAYELTERQRDVLAAWAATGAVKGTRANQDPTATLTEPLPAQVDQALTIGLRADDADGDGLLVAIGVRDLVTGDEQLVAHGLPSGLATAAVDTGQLASGHAVEVFAVVDDGFADDPAANQHRITLAPSLPVDHGALGTAPTVRVLAPNGGEAVLGAIPISWAATDPDPGDTLTIDVALIRVAPDGTGTVAAALATGLVGVSTFTWDPAGVPFEDAGQPIPYRIRVAVTDGQNQRSDESDAPFTIAPPPVDTTLTWADVKPIFLTYCKPCHGQPARTVALESFRLDKYDAADPEPPLNSDLGVYDMRSQVFARMITQANMPPPAAAAQPAAADRAKVEQWILGGAPFGSGPVDGAPAFAWLTPNDTTITTTTTTGQVTLAWTTSDPEGLPVTGAIAYAQIAAQADATAVCNAGVTGWVDLPVAVTAGTLAWTAPARGYFCLRGTVTDAANQTTVRVAAKPVKYRTTPGP